MAIAAGNVCGDAARVAELEQLVADPALADAGRADDPDDLPLAFLDPAHRRLELGELSLAAGERRQTTLQRDVEAITSRPHAGRCECADRLRGALSLRGAAVPQVDVAPGQG